MASRRIAAALALLAAVSTVSSLYVVPGSSCAAMCLGNSTSTSTDMTIDASDIACEDGDFSSEAKGIKFRNCIDCLQQSQEANGDNSDVKFMLYNMRFALDTCLYNPDFKIQSPCIIKAACEPLEPALEAGLDTPGKGEFDYCTAAGNVFSSRSHWGCVSCLHASDNQAYLSNFLQTLKAGCEQRPDPGNPIIYRGDIFSDDLLNITVHNITLPGEGGAGSNDITTGTIVGIAAGAGLFLIGVAATLWAYCRRRKKRQAAEAAAADQTPPPDRSNASSFTALNHSPYLTVGDHKKSPSVRSTDYELREKQNFTSNADYYERYEEDARAGRHNAQYNFDPRSTQSGPGSALPTHPAYNPRMTMSRITPSPVPSAHRRTETPESYALQAYLSANDSGSHHESSRSRSRSVTPSGRGSPSNGRASAEHVVTGIATATTLTSIPPPPPGPPPAHSGQGSKQSAHSKSPSITIPSVPRVKVPKKYIPPTIVVDSASPDGSRMHISEPIHSREERFQDRPLGCGHVVVSTDQVDPRRDVDPRSLGDQPINTGKSTLYG